MHKTEDDMNSTAWNRIRKTYIPRLLVCLFGTGLVIFMLVVLIGKLNPGPNRTNRSAIWKEKPAMSASTANMAAYQEKPVKAASLPAKFETATFALG